MLFPKLFNHGNLRSVKVEEGKVTFEGVYGKETFEGGGGDVHGIPSGGTSGQVLAKTSSTDYEAGWADTHQVPSGGAQGQVLAKTSATDYDAGWSDVNQVPTGGSQNQVLTKGSSGYDWADVNAVPTGGTQGQVLTKGASGYGWSTPSDYGLKTVILTIDTELSIFDDYIMDGNVLQLTDILSASATPEIELLTNNEYVQVYVRLVGDNEMYLFSFITQYHSSKSNYFGSVVYKYGDDPTTGTTPYLVAGSLKLNKSTSQPMTSMKLVITGSDIWQ